jgi:predicted type IV restriction endonuclease
MQEPSDEFVKFIASQVYGGRMTQSVREQFAQLTKQAFKQVVNEQINERLKSALASESTPVQSSESNVQVPGGTSEEATSTDQTSNAVTTEDEMDAYYIIRAA